MFFWDSPNPDFRIQKRILRFLGGKSKNGSRIHKVHTQGGFFGSNSNPKVRDSQSERFFAKGVEKSIFDKREKRNGTRRMPYMYDILTERMLVAPYFQTLTCHVFLYVCSFCLRRFIVQVIKKTIHRLHF